MLNYNDLRGYMKTECIKRVQQWSFASSFPMVSGFTGNIAKFIGVRFAMIFYTTRPACVRDTPRGPPMAGPQHHPIRLIPQDEGVAQPTERRRETPYNLAIILVFIPVRPLLSLT